LPREASVREQATSTQEQSTNARRLKRFRDRARPLAAAGAILTGGIMAGCV
jgi:hypothetical protein